MVPRGESLSRGMSMDDIIFVPLTTRQQRISSERYVERLIVFFQKGTDVYTVINSAKEVLRKRHRLGIAGGWLFAHGMARIAVRIVPIVEEWPVVLSVQWILISYTPHLF